jgi:hypothetical protein
MSQTVYTMPEPKFRSTKKRAQAVPSFRNSEFAQEIKTSKPKPQPVPVGAPAPVQAPLHVEVQVELQLKAESQRPPKARASFTVATLWPVAVGIFLAGFAPEWQAMATQMGVWVMRFAFPLSLLAMRHDLGLDAQMSTMLPQIALYAQLPLDGVLAALTLARGKSLRAVLVQLLLVHGVCAFVLWLLSMNAN